MDELSDRGHDGQEDQPDEQCNPTIVRIRRISSRSAAHSDRKYSRSAALCRCDSPIVSAGTRIRNSTGSSEASGPLLDDGGQDLRMQGPDRAAVARPVRITAKGCAAKARSHRVSRREPRSLYLCRYCRRRLPLCRVRLAAATSDDLGPSRNRSPAISLGNSGDRNSVQQLKPRLLDHNMEGAEHGDNRSAGK